MIKIIFLIKRKPELNVDQFRHHYENSHVPLAKKHFGDIILDYRRNYPKTSGLNPVDNAADGGISAPIPYDAITEMVLADEASLNEMLRRFGSSDLQNLLAEDEARFMDREALTMLICDEKISWSTISR